MNSFSQLEYDKVKSIIANECQCPLGYEKAVSLIPINNKTEIEYSLAIIEELQGLQKNTLSFNFHKVSDVSKLITEIKHQTFNFEEFRRIYFNISAANSVGCPEEDIEDNPKFVQIVNKILELPDLENRFNNIFDADGDVKDNASSALASIRKRKRKLRQNVVSTLNSRVEEYTKQNFLQDKIVTQRDGRFVIPVKESQTPFVQGIVHGRSSSRASVYVEPQEVVGLNNDIELASSEEKQEIFRIFSEYTQQIRDFSGDIIENTYQIGLLDYFSSAARFANRLECNKPEILEKPYIKLSNARHPLLIETMGSIKKVIPFNLELGKDFRLLLISGPNTGGKTVTLKTVGLLTLMALSGLPIPAQIDSKIGMFHNVFADIGDNQSLENALSTFSSHIKNIDEMVKKGNSNSLVLIDEIGAATDPEQGSALAQAILEKLAEHNITGVITTHYTALKVFAEQHENCSNAAMQFDVEKHIPTYSFKLGLPGNSFAIEIASRLGMNDSLIERAKELAGSQNVEMTDLLKKMSEEKKSLARENYQYQLKSALLSKKIEEHQQKIDTLNKDSKEIKKKSMLQARDFLTGLQKELNKEISDIKKADKNQRKENLEKSLIKINRKNKEFGFEIDDLSDLQRTKVQTPQIGQNVWLNDVETEGEIVSINGKSIKVDMGGIYFTTTLENIYKLAPKPKRKTSRRSKVPKANVKLELKILGFTFDEAKPEIDKFIDDAAMNGLGSIRIVHGKGTGALRAKVRQYLRSNRKELDFFTPPPEAGGDGVTVLKLG
jgi:DNA mismatch repair protein MutS2